MISKALEAQITFYRIGTIYGEHKIGMKGKKVKVKNHWSVLKAFSFSLYNKGCDLFLSSGTYALMALMYI
jgi:hypothetical protein